MPSARLHEVCWLVKDTFVVLRCSGLNKTLTMRFIFAVLSICIVLVHCQHRPPRPPPAGALQGTPVPISSPTDAPESTSPPRPKGCSPGCGPTEICAELGASYCRGGQACSVCIKMSSIRFPASALAGMFGAQTQKPEAPTQPVVPSMPMTPAVNPLLISKKETEISILEYAAEHRKALHMDETGNIRPQRPQAANGPTGYDVLSAQSVPQLLDGMVDLPVTTPPIVESTRMDINRLESQSVKYPIIVRVPGDLRSAQSQIGADTSTVSQSPDDHFGHIDQTQMEKWYQRYLQFKAEQARLGNSNSQATTTAGQSSNTDAFDYASFQLFQNWLQQNQNEPGVASQTTALPSMSQTPPVVASVQHQFSGLQLPITLGQDNLMPANPFNYANIQQQFQEWQQQQNQRQTTPSSTPVDMVGSFNPTTGANQQRNSLDAMTIEQQFMQWQNQQQQLQQQQPQQLQQNQRQTNPSSTPVDMVGSFNPTTGANQQQNTINAMTFEQQFMQWQNQQQQLQQQQPQQLQQNSVQTNTGQTNTAGNIGPSASQDITTRQQTDNLFNQLFLEWQQQQQQQQHLQQTQGHSAMQIPNSVTNVHDVNLHLNQAGQQENQTNSIQNAPSTTQQENTVSYVPQQQANTFNDPFNFFSFDPLPQQNTLFGGMNTNNMFGLMMFDGLGFGGGFGF